MLFIKNKNFVSIKLRETLISSEHFWTEVIESSGASVPIGTDTFFNANK